MDQAGPSTIRQPVGLGISQTPAHPASPAYHSDSSPGDVTFDDNGEGEGEGEGEGHEDEDEDGGEEGVEEGEEEEEGEDEGEDVDVMSETSSAMFDPDADPEGWGRRLDELAGVLEMGEVEARAIRWGPPIGKMKSTPPLPLGQFKELVDRHLATTEWKYTPKEELLPVVPGRLGASRGGQGTALDPIRVLGRAQVGREVGGGEVTELDLRAGF
ncbi:hypothetical protein JCM24511_06796 [Saitozyma sp. JCM 24511]|nr:hypothetical protein JCM24511_06796 [Saitozyma sp. JCM 24511]